MFALVGGDDFLISHSAVLRHGSRWVRKGTNMGHGTTATKLWGVTQFFFLDGTRLEMGRYGHGTIKNSTAWSVGHL